MGITGLGGIGKSALAARIYEDSHEFDGKFWGDVRSGTPFIDLAQRVLLEWGMSEVELANIQKIDPTRDPTRRKEQEIAADVSAAIQETNLEILLTKALLGRLKSGCYLLAIDNAEMLLNPEGQWQSPFYEEFLRQWLEQGNRSTLLLISRERPKISLIRSEWYELENGLSLAEGAALLRDLGVRGADEELQLVVKQVNGYPLSLWLVAGLLRTEEKKDPHIRHLSRYGDLFQVEGLHRGQTLSVEQIFNWSFDRLCHSHQRLFVRLSVYRVPFNATAAASINAKITMTEQDLRELERRSLLQELSKRDKTDQRQFRMQPQVLEFAKGKAGDLTEAHQWAIRYYLTNLKPQPWQVLGDITEYLEIFFHLCELRQYEDASDILRDCDKFLDLQGYYTVLIENHNQLLEVWKLTPPIDRLKQAASLASLGNAYCSIGRFREAVQLHQDCLDIMRQIPDRKGEAVALNNLGNAQLRLGQYQQALDSHQQAFKVRQQLGDEPGKIASLNNLGEVYREQGQLSKAIVCYLQSANMAHQTGNDRGEAAALANLGNAYSAKSHYAAAIVFYRSLLNVSKRTGDQQGKANSLCNLGNVYHYLGRSDRAIEEFYEKSLEISQHIGDRYGESICLNNLGEAYRTLGKSSEAIEFYQKALEISQQIGDQHGEAIAWVNLGNTLEQRGQKSEAISAYQNARHLYQALGFTQAVEDCDTTIQQISSKFNNSFQVQSVGSLIQHWQQLLWQILRRWFQR